MLKLGAITVGQSPRTDLIPEMLPVLEGSVELIQAGGLDGLTREEIEAFRPSGNDHILVSRLRDGTSVTFGESHILPRLQNCIHDLEQQGVSLILFLCTGEFPETFQSHVPLIFPSRILTSVVPAIFPRCRLAVITPSPDQIPQVTARWAPLSARVTVAAASPYDGPAAVSAALKTIPDDADLVLLDCIGYTMEMKRMASMQTRKPVILPRTLIARLLRELA